MKQTKKKNVWLVAFLAVGSIVSTLEYLVMCFFDFIFKCYLPN
jgi:hypothetical protein